MPDSTKITAMRKKLGENIRRARLARGLTQEALTALLEVSSLTSFVRWERGERTPTLEHLVDLATALQVAPGDLLADMGEPHTGADDVEEASRLLRGMPDARRAVAVSMLRELSRTE